MTNSSSSTSPSAGPARPDGEGADERREASLLDDLSPAEFEALQWSVRVSDGLSAQAHGEFEAWLNAHAEHRAAYEDVAGVWHAVDDAVHGGAARLRTAVAIDAASASSARDVASRAQSATGILAVGADEPAMAAPRRRLLSQALTATLLIGTVGGGWFGWDHWQNQAVFSRDYATRRGQSLEVALPDGSDMVLDTNSRTEVTLYRNRREVRMPEGQVFFHVQSDKGKHFDVIAGAARITVVGTKFSVRYTPSLGQQAVQVAVVDGKVRVARADITADGTQARTVELTSGQAVTADAQGHVGAVTSVAPQAIAPWRGQRLSFDNAALSDVLAEIGRYGDTGLRVHDPAIARLPITASVDLRHVDTFTRTLPRVLPVRLVPGEGGLQIVAIPR